MWLILCCVCTLWLWVHICIYRAGKQRLILLKTLFLVDRRNRFTLGTEYIVAHLDRVNFISHVWYLMTFRNPAKLYDRHESAHQVPAHEA